MAGQSGAKQSRNSTARQISGQRRAKHSTAESRAKHIRPKVSTAKWGKQNETDLASLLIRTHGTNRIERSRPAPPHHPTFVTSHGWAPSPSGGYKPSKPQRKIQTSDSMVAKRGLKKTDKKIHANGTKSFIFIRLRQ